MFQVIPHPEDVVRVPVKGKGKGPPMVLPRPTSAQLAKTDPWMNLPLPPAPTEDDDLDGDPPSTNDTWRKYYDYEYNPSSKYDTDYYKALYRLENMGTKDLLLMLKNDIDDLKLQLKDQCRGSYVVPPGSIGNANIPTKKQIDDRKQQANAIEWLVFYFDLKDANLLPNNKIGIRQLERHYVKGEALPDGAVIRIPPGTKTSKGKLIEIPKIPDASKQRRRRTRRWKSRTRSHRQTQTRSGRRVRKP